MKEHNIISANVSTICENKDVCDDQYRYYKALYLLSMLSPAYNIITECYVGAPNHGKYTVGGLNYI